ncbi:MAG TPA: DUF5069 domain-containing protein [Opitutaceae bacterium]|nr:DUF5069 domain-containing protein [Opitutaceae bacterium]
MEHYDFHKEFRALYDKAAKQFAAGKRNPDELFAKHELAFLASIGSRPQDLYDYAEDAANYGEPDFETALLVQAVRRSYFLLVQKGTPSKVVLDEGAMPAKTAAVRGIEWLPRLMPKARAKLRGELPTSLMYGCGGDRRFFKQHDIHPAEFLHVVWHAGDDEKAIVDWVAKRAKL